MKHMFLTTLMVGISMLASAQVKDTTLNEYVGKYSFPEGSFVTTAEVVLNGDELMVTSSEGNSPLAKRGKDTFALVNYEGMVYFSRNTAGKVARIKVELTDILLEGTREGVPTALHNRNVFFYNRKQTGAR